MKTKNPIVKIKFVPKNGSHVEFSLSMREVISFMMSIYFMVTEHSVSTESLSLLAEIFKHLSRN